MSLDWTHTFSPTFFNEFMFSASRSAGALLRRPNARYTTRTGPAQPQRPAGLPGGEQHRGGHRQQQLLPAGELRQQFFNYFIMEDNGTKIAGKHEIQYGMHLRYDQLTYMPQQQRTAGT